MVIMLKNSIYSIALAGLALGASLHSRSSDSTLYNGQTAVYWGQASAQEQNRLRYYCDSESVDIYILSFITDFPNYYGNEHGYKLDLANSCSSVQDDSSTDEWGYTASSSSNTVANCSEVGDDIKYCQSLNKTVLLSLGGESGTYGFTSDTEAESFATVLWNSFGEGEDYSSVERPFGDAIIDGYDFDLENQQQTGYVALANKLQEYGETNGTKKYIYTSAPQCPFPDQSNSDLIDNFELDYLFVQFYNNDCSLDQNFNFDTWVDHIQTLLYNKTKIFIGLPANSSAASSGYVDSDTIITKIEEIYSNDTLKNYFGGVMFWDASQGFGYSSAAIDSESNVITTVAAALQIDTSSTTESSSGTTVTTDNTTSSATSKEKNDSFKVSAFSIYNLLIVFGLQLFLFNLF